MDKKKKMAKKMKSKSSHYDSLSDMMDYEDGTASEKQVKKLFQHLVDTGLAWHLQGSYGRAANDMLQSGFIKPPKNRSGVDFYGNKLDSYYKNFD